MERSFLTTFAYAKINLALAVNGIREDGYHELQSVMQSIALHDIVRIRQHGEKIICRCGRLSGPENLAYKAAVLFIEHLQQVQGLQPEGIEIEIDKKVPVQAGLAGGSSDAAATLQLLNQLHGDPFDSETLMELAGKCGSDVAFCLQGGTMWATGRGEHLERLPDTPLLHLVLIKPEAGVNTGEAYRRFDAIGQGGHLERSEWVEALKHGAPLKIAGLLTNDLEAASIQMVPEILDIKQFLIKEGCYGALMSGSGSSVFGVAQDQQHASKVAERLRNQGYRNVWVTETTGNQIGRF